MSLSRTSLIIAICSLGTTLPAWANDIRDQLTPDLIYQHCRAAGVGSETEGTFMLPGGRVTGSVRCSEADLAASNGMAAGRHGDDDDDDEDDDDRHERDRHD